MDPLQILTLVLLVIILSVVVLSLFSKRKDSLSGELKSFRNELANENQRTIKTFNDVFVSSNQSTNAVIDKRLTELTQLLHNNQQGLNKTVSDSLQQIQTLLNNHAIQNEQKLNQIRETVEKRLQFLQEENSKKLDEMRMTVDEKLQKTLEERISQSFKQVTEQLESVYKSLGEMKNIGLEVGDLKKVLSNVKTKGILGEIQLGAILEQILSPEQYIRDTATYPGSRDRVEFAVKLPGDERGHVLLPIDSKFPTEDFVKLMDAYDAGDKTLVDLHLKALEANIRKFAKDIHDKYIKIPYTTEFGILFLPTEGLYAEVVRGGMVEALQRDYQINIAGPTTMAALLNSLQMGFKTLAIQKRSGEVWSILSSVKTEFQEFGNVLQSAQDKLTKTGEELDKLVGVRTRQINKKLKDVSVLDVGKSQLLETEDDKDESNE
jgi:DNA recombination protein RmuC